MRDPKRTLHSILAAGERVILRNGIAKLTLEDVARECAISKGGVLHHFPHKEALLVAVYQNLVNRFEADIEKLRSADPDPRGAFTRAYLQAALNPKACSVDVFLELNAAFSYTPALLDLYRQTSARWQEQVEADQIDPGHASIVRFAADGLWRARIHNVPAPSEEVRASLRRVLLAMTHGETIAA
jgi:AcrR family transcriptional regulator